MNQDFKDVGVIYTGTIGSISIAQVLPVFSLVVMALTIIYTILRIIDLVETRRERKNKKETNV